MRKNKKKSMRKKIINLIKFIFESNFVLKKKEVEDKDTMRTDL